MKRYLTVSWSLLVTTLCQARSLKRNGRSSWLKSTQMSMPSYSLKIVYPSRLKLGYQGLTKTRRLKSWLIRSLIASLHLTTMRCRISWPSALKLFVNVILKRQSRFKRRWLSTRMQTLRSFLSLKCSSAHLGQNMLITRLLSSTLSRSKGKISKSCKLRNPQISSGRIDTFQALRGSCADVLLASLW